MALRYESLSFENVHSSILDLLPQAGARVLDVGAGSGRDAAAMAERGFVVAAVEPSLAMRKYARALHRSARIDWVNDALPHLGNTTVRRQRYDFILVSAVWMYIPLRDRHPAIRTLARLLKKSGILVITLRHGPQAGARGIRQASADGLLALAESEKLRAVRVIHTTPDQLNRRFVNWSTVVLKRDSAD